MKGLHIIAFILVIIGALNWGLVGAFDYNLVDSLLGMGGVSTTIYVLVGLAALYELFTHPKNCRLCKPSM